MVLYLGINQISIFFIYVDLLFQQILSPLQLGGKLSPVDH